MSGNWWPGCQRPSDKGSPLYLLAGEDDFSGTAEDTLRTARSIPGAQVTIMEKLGHFPMSENPAQFRRYVAPVPDQIRLVG